MGFTADPAGIAALARSADMTRYLRDVAEAGAAEVEAVAPNIVKHAGSSIHGEASPGEGRIVVDSPFWHLPEYGATRYPQRSFIRPTAARFFAAIGGRFIGR